MKFGKEVTYSLETSFYPGRISGSFRIAGEAGLQYFLLSHEPISRIFLFSDGRTRRS